MQAEINWKPLVALAFAMILLAAGAWSSRRAPWKGRRRRRAALQAFGTFSLPFVVLEVGTGITSLLAGVLSIPPELGIGTAVDLGILFTGLFAAAYPSVRARRPNDVSVGR